MPIIVPSEIRDEYDAIVVGSGAAGGQAAYTLTMSGLRVLMLEAGRDYDPAAETPMFQIPSQAPLRGVPTSDKPHGFYSGLVAGGTEIEGEPYTQASSVPLEQFEWKRARMLGGRTNHWARVALRAGPYDFQPRGRDGLGVDWPLTYDEIAPYYDRVERLIGVYGENEGLENTPDSPPGVLQPAPTPRAYELLARKVMNGLGIPVIPAHRAVLTRRLDAGRLPALLHPDNLEAQQILAQSMSERAACFWATNCLRGCSIRATYQSPTVHLPPAFATGRLDLIPLAMAREIEIDAQGRASGVVFIDKTDRSEHRARARAVVLGASTGETVRLLLNSRSPRFPDGLANSSGLVGRYLLDTVGANLAGQIPQLEDLPPHNEDGAGGPHVYAPWWRYGDQIAGRLDFPRGYHIEFGGGRQMPNFGTLAGLERFTGGTYGRRFKEDARRYYGTFLHFAGRGEMIPNERSFCTLDPDVKDQWGIPVLRFSWHWTDYELKQAEHMARTFHDIITAMGGRVLGPHANRDAIAGSKVIRKGGQVTHEVGGARMGDDSRTSVTDQWGRTWDVPNLYLVDGAVFCSKPDKNPTLTILALAWRTADRLVAAGRQGGR